MGNGECSLSGPRALLLYSGGGGGEGNVAGGSRVLFNCPEGTQRLVSEQCPPHALFNLEAAFFTGREGRHLGGLPGLCLSAAASGAPDLRWDNFAVLISSVVVHFPFVL